MPQSDELRRKQLLAELSEGGQSHKRFQIIALVIFLAVVLSVYHMVGSCSKSSVLAGYEDDAVTQFTRALKGLGAPKATPSSFAGADKGFDLVLNSEKLYEPYVYKAMIQLISYDWYLRQKKTPDDKCLPEADKDLSEAEALNPKGCEAHYYLAALANFKDDKSRCDSELDQCLKLSDSLEGPARQQWKDKVDGCKAALAKTPPGAFDVVPPRVMVPKLEIIKADE